MTAGQSTKKPDISFAKDGRRRIFSWIAARGAALKPIKGRLRPLAFGIKKNAAVVFAILLAAGVMEFDYYQERLTREYLRALLIDAARVSSDVDGLDAKLSQLNMKIDVLDAKFDKLQLSAAAAVARPRSAFPRSR